jgi:hypothetical protein
VECRRHVPYENQHAKHGPSDFVYAARQRGQSVGLQRHIDTDANRSGALAVARAQLKGGASSEFLDQGST